MAKMAIARQWGLIFDPCSSPTGAATVGVAGWIDAAVAGI
jgi:hypothetical protein